MTRPIRRVLVANRGEIAVRILRACRELGIETVQAHSEADRDSMAVQMADRAVCIGLPPSTQSYLDPVALVSAAVSQGADAIHPGYGFLSEKAAFAGLCDRHGITFIGPRASVIPLMGDKATARRIAAEAGVPVTPGSSDTLTDAADALRVARGLGFPVLLKASAGGGGRGMRVVNEERELTDAFQQASAEALSAFEIGRAHV